MSSKSKSLRAFASSRETQIEEASPALLPKLRFPDSQDESHAKPRSREEDNEGGMQ